MKELFDYLDDFLVSLGRCKQKQRGLRGLLCRWPSITEWEMYITAQGCRLRNDLYCVEWDVKLYYTIPLGIAKGFFISLQAGCPSCHITNIVEALKG